jgi:ketosteroid isomerase-like protein
MTRIHVSAVAGLVAILIVLSLTSAVSSSKRDENEAIIKKFCEAWKKSDAPTMFSLYHDEFVLHYFGRSPLAGEHRGKTAVLGVLAKVQKLTNRQLVEIRDLLASDSHAIVIARERFERDGKQLEANRVFIYRIRDGKLGECWVYDEDQRAVDEFWRGI